jgi:hypothetical protein
VKHGMALISVAAVATAAVAICVSSAGAVPVVRTSTIATFQDSVGEVAGGPDISAVTVSLDGAVLTVDATVAGMPEVMSDGEVMFLLNTDGNSTTGSLNGADYVLFLDMKTLEGSVLHWNGSDYVDADKVADPSRTMIGGGGAGFMFNLANLGSPTHIDFAMAVLKGSTDSGLMDVAPDSGLWGFDTTVAPTPTPAPKPTPVPAPAVVKPVFGTPTMVPAKPVAGKRVVFTLAVKRSDTGARLTTGKMTCDPSVSGKVISHAESFKGGTAKLVFTLPKSAKGKTLKVKVTIAVGKQSATKVVTYKVT